MKKEDITNTGTEINQGSSKNQMGFFSSWRKFGFLSAHHWQIILYWISLLFFIGYLPIYIVSNPRRLDNYFLSISSNYYPVIVIICLSFIVIAVGTLIYAIDVSKQTFRANNKIKFVHPLYFFSSFLCYVSVFICFFGIYNINAANDIHEIVLATEHYTMCIFIILLIIDILTLIAKKTEITYHKKNKLNNLDTLKDESKFLLNQMFFIDLPVLIGVIFISTFIHSADSTGFYSIQISKLDKVDNFQFFKTYFTVGGIGMHIIFSQFIFVILNTRSIYQKIVNKL